MKVTLSRSAEKAINRLPRQDVHRVFGILDRLESEEPNIDIKRIVGTDQYRIRVGDLRILVVFENDEAFVEEIVRRGAAYR